MLILLEHFEWRWSKAVVYSLHVGHYETAKLLDILQFAKIMEKSAFLHENA